MSAYTDRTRIRDNGESSTKSVTDSPGGTQLLPDAIIPRNAITITNCDTTAVLYIGVGFVPTTTAYSVKLNPGAIFGFDITVPQDIITGLSSSGSINSRIYAG